MTRIQAPLIIQLNEEAAEVASNAFSAIADPTDPTLLDEFIARFPGSREANLALSMRYQLLRANPSPEDYHEFIAIYDGLSINELALYELFALLQARETVSDFVQFLERYPDSELAVPAEVQVHALSFATACTFNTIPFYDSFIRAFPRAAQIPTAARFAQELAIARAVSEREANTTESPQEQANILINTRFGPAFEEFVVKWGLPNPVGGDASAPPGFETKLLTADASEGERLLDYHRLRRIKSIITQVYADTDAATAFTLDNVQNMYLRSIEVKLGDLIEVIKESHKFLISTLEKEFDETRKALNRGFEQIYAGIEDLTETVSSSFKDLASAVKLVHQELVQLNENVYTVAQHLKESTTILQNIDMELIGVGGRLWTLNETVSNGFQAVSGDLQGLRTQMSLGFDRMVTAIDSIDIGSAGGGGWALNIPGVSVVRKLKPSIPWDLGSLSNREFKVPRGMPNLGALQAGYEEIEQRATSTSQALKKQAMRTRESMSEAVDSAADSTKKMLNRIWNLGDSFVVFDITTEGRLSLNVRTGSYFSELMIPLGGKLDSRQLTSGEAPSLDAAEALKAAARSMGFKVTVRNDYDDVRRRLFNEADEKAVYFSSPRFVQWAGSESIASYAAESLLTGGATANEVLREMQHQLMLELNDVYSWLTAVGHAEIQQQVNEILRSLLSFGGATAQPPGLEIKWVDVNYYYKLDLGRASELIGLIEEEIGDPLKWIKEELAAGPLRERFPNLAQIIENPELEIAVKHKAIVIETEPGSIPDEWLVSLGSNLAQSQKSIPQADIGSLITSALNNAADAFEAQLGHLDYQAFSTGNIPDELGQQVFDALKLDHPGVQSALILGSRVVDLRGTETAQALGWICDRLTIGNEGSVIIRRCDVDLASGSLTVDVSLRHRHVWQLRDLPEQARTYLEQLGHF